MPTSTTHRRGVTHARSRIVVVTTFSDCFPC